jgi:hypothetical protein
VTVSRASPRARCAGHPRSCRSRDTCSLDLRQLDGPPEQQLMALFPGYAQLLRPPKAGDTGRQPLLTVREQRRCGGNSLLGMRSSVPGVQRVLVLLGFLLVAAGQLPPLGFVSFSPHNYDFFWIVSAVGYALLGCASWAWLTALSRSREGGTEMHKVLMLVAIACLVLGVAYAGLINEVIELHRQAHHSGLRRELLSYGLPFVGFWWAAAGFWGASRNSRNLDSTTSTMEAGVKTP